MENERESAVVQRRALRAGRALNAGETLNAENVVALRPCPEEGLPPYRIDSLLGRRVRVALDAGQLISMADLAD